MNNYWFLFLIIPIIRLLIYSNHYRYLAKVVKKHEHYVQGVLQNSTDDKKSKSNKAAKWLQNNQVEIKNRIIQAGVDDPIRSRMAPLGLGYAQQQNMSPLDNLLFKNAEILGLARDAMIRAKGYFRGEAIKSLNPIFWIELVVFLPREVVAFSGLNLDSQKARGFVNIIQLIYWLISIYYMVIKIQQVQ